MRVVPGIGAMSSPWASSQARATWAGVAPISAGDGVDLVDDVQVAFEVAAGDARVGAPPVVGVEAVQGSDGAGEEAVAERGLGGQHHLVPASLDGPADQLLVGGPVQVGGVDVRDTEIKGAVDRADRLVAEATALV
ncbi:hypothetical protein H4W31_004895 [Plantactinospora soyae]|uniref:Uncharacterized protein n=1 Tax=Plantactinospora soyae TaxID=1544732 RepID=A0A927QZN5_9ACTN|nr:hypothetical protein [Plantactinospora soyae]